VSQARADKVHAEILAVGKLDQFTVQTHRRGLYKLLQPRFAKYGLAIGLISLEGEYGGFNPAAWIGLQPEDVLNLWVYANSGQGPSGA
jgi:hypothetical protein